ncbi:MAG: response regulator [Ruminiclostridium sp.]|nr:response regulator [Ruminiclostridium sp.]
MKKIMLIGEPTGNTKVLADKLAADFSVQTGSFDAEAVYATLEAFRPDMIVISLEGIRESSKAIFRHISTNYASTPVFTVGTEKEREVFGQYYREKQFENIERTDPPDSVCETIAAKLGEGGAAHAKGYIMIVDDDMSVLRSVKAMLEDEYEVVIASSGTSAIKMMDKRVPDLVLLDYEMPHCDGRETLQMIRTIDKTKDVPVMFLTSITDQDHIDAVLGLSPLGYLVKPADPVALKEAVERVLYLL